MQLDSVPTQAEFGALIGVSQPAVSEMLSRGVLPPGETCRVLVRSYCVHIREQAAGRDPDGELAAARTRLSNEQADRVAMANAIARREYLPVAIIEDVLSRVARQLAAIFESVVPELRKDMPQLPGEALRIVEVKLVRARELAASISLDAPESDFDAEDESTDEQEAAQ